MEETLESQKSLKQQQQKDDQQSMAMNVIIEQWEVQYARFVNYPPLSSLEASNHHSSITPHSTRKRKCSRGGVWISTSSSSSSSSNSINSFPSASAATLKLISDCSAGSDDAILNISLRSKAIEEHYISKLHFSWPQVSCVSGFPTRGTRSVFLSYKDSLGQDQKFALRFATIQETENFIRLLKHILDDTEPEALPRTEITSEPSLQSEVVPSSGLSNRAEEDCWTAVSTDNYGNEMSETQNNDFSDFPTTQELISDSQLEVTLSDFPPSFASFVKNCCPAAGKDQPKRLDEADLKSLVAKYLEDSSFQDMFVKVEKVMNEMGHNIIL